MRPLFLIVGALLGGIVFERFEGVVVGAALGYLLSELIKLRARMVAVEQQLADLKRNQALVLRSATAQSEPVRRA